MKTNLQPQRLAGIALAAALALPLAGQAQLCTPGNYQAIVESGNIKTTLLNGGDMFWNLSDARFEVPKGSGKHSLFAGAFWFGGIDQDNGNELNLSVQTYRQGSPADVGFWPGPLDASGQTNATVCSGFNFIAKVHKPVVDAFRAMTFPVDQIDIPQEILMWPAQGNSFHPAVNNFGGGHLAPFYDVDSDGIYDPRQGDYPVFPGDQALFTILNDAGGIKSPMSPTMGLQVNIMMYGFDAPTNPAVRNTIFAQYVFINRGTKTLTDTYFGNWADFDLGNYDDDFVGADPAHNMFYAYNADSLDEGSLGYGANPPAQGVMFLNVPMTNFTYYENNMSPINGNPMVDTDYYNYMTSRWKNGNHVMHGGDGVTGTTPANIMFPGDPETVNGWSEVAENHVGGDRRGIGAHGPFTFAPGQVKVIDVAFPWAQGTSYLNSVTHLQQAAAEIQHFYHGVIMGAETPVTDQTLALQLYPNPTKANITVQCAGTAAQATFTLLDLTGRTVQQTTAQLPAGAARHQLNLEHVPQGMYLLQVQRGEVSQTIQVVKQ